MMHHFTYLCIGVAIGAFGNLMYNKKTNNPSLYIIGQISECFLPLILHSHQARTYVTTSAQYLEDNSEKDSNVNYNNLKKIKNSFNGNLIIWDCSTG